MPAQLNQQTISVETKCVWFADHSTVLLIGSINEQLLMYLETCTAKGHKLNLL